ncbi:STAS domain-containing protein [Streptomyces endophytica]|uniref:STAS domain-containing protein n=1 Tax=Streptomyces endophytica TaxID=2991496 RepID=A0ABY6PGE8_9ACTN|nr:STAS domain-containing protein [Streptomyces endophytica]UZJ32455.1 STAS domain-containing protein [Streptomyces endophytica]
MSSEMRSLAVTSVVEAEECAVLRVSGELDLRTEQAFLAEARSVVSAGHRFLVLDLTALRFCDSRGLSCLLALEWLCRRLEGRLLLASLGVRMLRLLVGTQSLGVFSCYPTVGHALAAVPDGARPAWPPPSTTRPCEAAVHPGDGPGQRIPSQAPSNRAKVIFRYGPDS